MSDGAVRARVESVRTLDHGVAAYGRAFDATVAGVRQELNRLLAAFTEANAVADRRFRDAERARHEAEAFAARARDDERAAAEARAARARAAEAAARRTLDQNRRAKAQLDRAAADLLAATRTAESSVAEQVPSGRAFVRGYAEDLQRYLARTDS
jgi:hypothetical protein